MRLITSSTFFTAGPIGWVWLVAVLVLAVFAVRNLTRESGARTQASRDAWAFYQAVALLLLLLVGIAQARAEVPMLDPCDVCRQVWPEWFCVLRGCW